MKSSNIGNTKLTQMPLLPILCVCENIDWTLFQFIQSGRELTQPWKCESIFNYFMIPTWSTSQILSMKEVDILFRQSIQPCHSYLFTLTEWHFLPTAYEVWRKALFSQACVTHSFSGYGRTQWSPTIHTLTRVNLRPDILHNTRHTPDLYYATSLWPDYAPFRTRLTRPIEVRILTGHALLVTNMYKCFYCHIIHSRKDEQI